MGGKTETIRWFLSQAIDAALKQRLPGRYVGKAPGRYNLQDNLEWEEVEGRLCRDRYLIGTNELY